MGELLQPGLEGLLVGSGAIPDVALFIIDIGMLPYFGEAVQKPSSRSRDQIVSLVP